MVRFQWCWSFGECGAPLHSLVPLWPRVVAPDRALSMAQIELNCVLRLNWITWNRTVLTFNCVFMINWTVWLNWIAWNRNVFDNQTVYSCLTELFELELIIKLCIKMDLALNNLKSLICHKTQTTNSVFIYIWLENSWIHSFPKDISAMWNVNHHSINLDLFCSKKKTEQIFN